MTPARAQRFIALLRAINVGGHTVKMDRLRALFEELDFSDVETFIASGNVIFTVREKDVRALERRIEKHLAQSLGYAVATFVRTPAELAAVASANPFGPATAEATVYVLFLGADPPAGASAQLAALQSPVDDFHLGDRVLYWRVRGKMMNSITTGARLEKIVGPGTARNRTTVERLAARYDTPSAKGELKT